ncbi:MAG: MoaD/ThiS family protein, partial [Pseudomonadota bacterium]
MEKPDMIRLCFFASLHETLGVAEEQIELPVSIKDVAELARWLQQRGEVWNDALEDSRLRVAINHEIVKP